ncbi:MAG: PIG-L deacetylase family protein [Chloroflexota bacterium]
MTDEPADILVVSPHPDDAEFGVSGSVARWVQEGKSVVYTVVTNGDKGTSDITMDLAKLAQIREEEQLAAARLLGVREVVFLRHPDQSLEETPEFRRDIVRVIRRFRPHTVISADPYRRYIWHRDHRITGRTVLDAVFPYARDYFAYPELIAEGLMPHKVREVLLWASEDPNYWMDVTATYETKLAALACHKSQIGEEIAPQMRDWLMERARTMAQGQDFELAEAFHQEIIWR